MKGNNCPLSGTYWVRGRAGGAARARRPAPPGEGTSTSPHSMTSSQGGMFSLSRVARPSRAESEALRTRIGTACFTIPSRRAVRRTAQERLNDELDGRCDERYIDRASRRKVRARRTAVTSRWGNMRRRLLRRRLLCRRSSAPASSAPAS